jgi:2-keto-4-pentenoate hydratase/2-oxohepta-3-ene-1,7-dioic acid hydratase in catechol pathway
MRWIKFSAEGRTAYGLVEGELVREVDGDPFAHYTRTTRLHALDAVAIEVPVFPRTFYCAGLNYARHIKEYAARLGIEPDLPKKPDIGYRAVNALVAHGEPVVIPSDASEQIHYEGELVVVIGKQVKNLSEEQALSCIFGYTIGNDVSERTWQACDKTLWRAKNTDTFKPMGPWIETEVDLDKLETIVRVNDVESSRFSTNAMLFGVATYISAMSRYLTLYPRDVIWMGTDGTSPNLKPGDVVEVEISGIGVLKNTFRAGL